jgi:hypothetical protein
MKRFGFTIIFAIFALMAFTTSASASAYGQNAFVLYSAASAGVKTSSGINVRGFKTKSMQVSGVTLASNPAAITYKNMSGTVVAECSQDNSLWVTCIANGYAETAISRTTNGIFTWSDAFNYVRLKWTSGTVGGKLKAWFSWLEN